MVYAHYPHLRRKRKGTLGSYYACSDYTGTNPEYGSVDDFKSLVTQAHDLGLKVIIDWVANHTGHGHTWTKTNPDFFKKNDRGEFYDTNGWEDVIDLDYSNPAMRQAMIDAMDFWVRETDIDGFRCDMAMLVPLDFWVAARRQHDARKKLFWLAECEEIHYHDAFDATYAWEWMHKTEDFARGRTDIGGLDWLLNKISDSYPPAALKTWFTSNHDENSWNGTEYEKYGNLALPFAVFSATWNGIPMIYSGQEGPNHKRLAFFDKDTISWNGQYALHGFYKKLLTLHATHPAARGGDPAVQTTRLYNTGQEVFSFLRQHGDAALLVLLNLSGHEVSVSLQDAPVTGFFEELFSGELIDFSIKKGVHLHAWGYKVFTKQLS
ncbi:MAG: alpha-amylase family glycosyl hydrolase [Flavihumibacter sp.]